MKIFDGCCAWFAPNVPAAHINTWLADGGVRIRDVGKSIVQYYFSNALDDDTTVALLRQQDKVVYKSAWITDSSLARTRQPLGTYALYEARPGVSSLFQSPRGSLGQRPHTVHSERRVSLVQRSLSQIHATPPRGQYFYSPPPASSTPSHLLSRRPRSVAGGDYYQAASADYYARLREGADDAQSVRSKSSRLSNASSVISNYGRRQHVISRFIVHADRQTRASILAEVSDFTPNSHGFVAYKIPKLTQ